MWRFAIRWILLSHLLILASSNKHENPANDLVDMVNENRTALKLKPLNNSPGLACMALQYIQLCKENCYNCTPPQENDFTQIFAPNCGIELPTMATISGHIVGCQPKYVNPTVAFTNVLVKDKKSLLLVANKSHTQVGIGLFGFHKGPFLWGVLFSDGPRNSTFVLEKHGEGIKQEKGCFSGTSFQCSAGDNNSLMFITLMLTIVISTLALL